MYVELLREVVNLRLLLLLQNGSVLALAMGKLKPIVYNVFRCRNRMANDEQLAGKPVRQPTSESLIVHCKICALKNAVHKNLSFGNKLARHLISRALGTLQLNRILKSYQTNFKWRTARWPLFL